LEDQFQHKTALKKTIWNPVEQPRRIQSTRDSKTAEFTAGVAEQS